MGPPNGRDPPIITYYRLYGSWIKVWLRWLKLGLRNPSQPQPLFAELGPNFVYKKSEVLNKYIMQFIENEAIPSSSSRNSPSSLVRRQARYWFLTIPASTPFVPGLYCFDYVKGQQEEGVERRDDSETGYLHWHLYGYSKKKISFRSIARSFGFSGFFGEPTHTEGAAEYVWKEDTRIEGTQFEFGLDPALGGLKTDWALVRSAAQAGNLESPDIPDHVFVQTYSALRRIATDYMRPSFVMRTTTVIWGKTGLGKSRCAWEQAGIDAYPKDPNSKFWCGYRGQQNVVIDEFRGGVNINHLLRWLDRYPVIVEIKGGAHVFKAECIWITSNLSPDEWYPNEDSDTIDALKRRLNTVIHADNHVFDWDLPSTPEIAELE